MTISKLLVTATSALFVGMTSFSYAQDNSPKAITPQEIEDIRRLLNQQSTAEVNTPGEIEALRRALRDAEAARSAPGYSNESVVQLKSRRISAAARGTSMPFPVNNLTLAKGMVSSVAFYDTKGVAWPVESVAYDQERIAVNNEGCSAGASQPLRDLSNVVVVTPCKFWTNANMQVLLQGETRPLTFNVTAGSRSDTIIADGIVTVAVASDAPRPFGLNRSGQLDNDWTFPESRAMRIDPVETTLGEVNQITVARGITTDLSFMDGSRTPWPIAEVSYAPGVIAVNGACEEAQAGLRQLKLDEDVSTIYVTACQAARATIAVRLQGRAGAISLLAVPARQNVRQPDGTLSITVPGVSPITPEVTSAAASVAGRPGVTGGDSFTHDRFLDDFLFGTPPQGARRARVSGAGDFPVEAWIFNGALYIRGGFRVINPAYDAGTQTTDGSMYLWKYGPPVSRILATDLSGREIVLNVAY